MDSLPTVLLRPGEADRVVAGHPWIYQGSILRLTQPARDGDLVQVKDHRQRFLGVGFFNSRSKIHVRMLAPERVAVDEGFFEQTIRAALGVRNKHLPDATSFRVVNSESDFLSGLVVDKYEDVLVLQTSSLGMDQRKPMIIAALQRIFSPRAILERNDISSRKFEGLPDANGLAAKCSFEAANVFDWLKAQTLAKPHEKVIPRFDWIILDPPSFTRNRSAVPDALRGYKEIHLRALKLLKTGGTLATFCCSHHVDAGLFQDTVLSAAYDAHRILRRVAIYTHSPDHPIIPMIPETEYLKGFAYEVVR